ncbi:MAG: hypothetical protein ACKOEX_06155 [Planctomycetia bacterium]
MTTRMPGATFPVRLAAAILGGIMAVPSLPAIAAPDASPTLAAREQELLKQFRDLEKSFLRLADVLAASDPRRAALLRGVFEQAREADVGERLDAIVALLEKNQFLKAGTSQSDAIDQMKELLALLESGDSEKSLTNTKEEVRQFISRVAKLIAKQRGLEGSTEFGGDDNPLAARQEALAEETRKLAGDIGGFAKRLEPRGSESGAAGSEGKESDAESGDVPEGGRPRNGEGSDGEKEGGSKEGSSGKSADGGRGAEGNGQGEGSQGEEGDAGTPSEGVGEEAKDAGDDEASRARRTRDRLQSAEKRMRDAERKLDEANRRDARAEQQKAIEELETARAELEEILRQMREEEVERLLVQLEARIRGMLRAEKAVLAGAEKADESSDRSSREAQLEVARLGREQAAVASDASKALAVVRDDGSAVAIPQALEQVRDDAMQAAGRLTRGDVGGTTRGIMQDVVSSLEEMLAALEKAQRDQQDKKQNSSGGRPAEPGEQPLVDKLAELKMIRSLQMRVNTRTGRFAQLLADGAEQAEEHELVEALERLSEGERSIQQATRDIVTGRTE